MEAVREMYYVKSDSLIFHSYKKDFEANTASKSWEPLRKAKQHCPLLSFLTNYAP